MENEMSSGNDVDSSNGRRFRFLGLAILSLVIGLVVTLTLLHPGTTSSLISLATNVSSRIQSSLSLFRFTLIVGFGGSLISISLIRKRGRDHSRSTENVKVIAVRHNVHPLMLTPRPSRDSSFVFRKTKNRGRLSRNREGERLPPSRPA